MLLDGRRSLCRVRRVPCRSFILLLWRGLAVVRRRLPGAAVSHRDHVAVLEALGQSVRVGLLRADQLAVLVDESATVLALLIVSHQVGVAVRGHGADVARVLLARLACRGQHAIMVVRAVKPPRRVLFDGLVAVCALALIVSSRMEIDHVRLVHCAVRDELVQDV